MDLVTLEAFGSLEEAYLAKNCLESEGIACFIQDGATTGQFGPNRPGFSAKLQVSQEHVNRAREILRDVKRGGSTE
jgi:Putative prokaryotic signal transducing protein